jgi:Predicted acyltransferase
MSSVTFKCIAYGSDDYYASVQLREEILLKPFGLHYSPETLAAEKYHMHLVGMLHNHVVATAVLVPEGDMFKMQRVAVRADLQGQGVGSVLMEICEQVAVQNGIKKMYCHARDSAVPFYLKNNYIPEGDYFDEDPGTPPHLKMYKLL